MTTQTFGFLRVRPFDEDQEFANEVIPLAGDQEIASTEGAGEYRYGCTTMVVVPGSSKTISDWDTFVSDHRGDGDSFLFKASRSSLKTVTAEAVGTGDGGTTVFLLDKKHIDASTLVVKVNGVTQTITTHYTFTLNNSTPTITFVSAPGGGLAVTADYEYLYPVRFTQLPPPGVRNFVNDCYKIGPVSVRSIGAGSHLA